VLRKKVVLRVLWVREERADSERCEGTKRATTGRAVWGCRDGKKLGKEGVKLVLGPQGVVSLPEDMMNADQANFGAADNP
jgi:hypothetical protein